MSKLKQLMLVGVALSPIALSATRGIESVHADTVKVVKQQPQKAASSASKDNVTVNKSDMIALDDKDFMKKFESSDYYQKEKALVGADNAKDDAALANQAAGYISGMIGEAFKEKINSPVIQKALGMTGPVGALINVMFDLFSKSPESATDKKLAELSQKLDSLGIKMTNDSQAMVKTIKKETISNDLNAFKKMYNKYDSSYFAHVNLSYQNDKQQLKDTLDTDNPVHLKKFCEDFSKLYASPQYGINQQNKISEIQGDNLSAFTSLSSFGNGIVNANSNNNDIFQLFADYESLKEYFNTNTFSVREAFSENVMTTYAVWMNQMATAILLDYFKVEGQIKNIYSGLQEQGIPVDGSLHSVRPLTDELLLHLQSAARNDLFRLGFDTTSHDGDDINVFAKNNRVVSSSPKSVQTPSHMNSLATNIKAVDFAYANTVRNSTGTLKSDDPSIIAAQKAADEADKQVASLTPGENDVYGHDDYVKLWEAQAIAKQAHQKLDQLKAGVTHILDENGAPLPGKLDVEEKVTEDAPLTYSYINNKWIYNRLDTQLFGDDTPIPSWYVAKYFANKSDRDKINELDNDGWNMKTARTKIWEGNHKLDNAAWNNALDHLLSDDELTALNEDAKVTIKSGLNSIVGQHNKSLVKTEGNKSIVIPAGLTSCYQTTRIATSAHNLDGCASGSAWFKAPTYQVNLGYFENNDLKVPSKSAKTFYQNLHYNGSKYTFNSQNYDTTAVGLMTQPKAGDKMLDKLQNGNQLPPKPEVDVDED
ncbi:hypothetical protein EFN46_08635 [Leuconostoc pseudomesenteroides]|uniref:hypothetical protein n=1 Tax=Leuconostoc pseudomesenteroides TaxID=33968 RepID=UPI0021AA5820|nr:hypothetical protein [Leuconostoc pseudomesenteroides]MCT4388266.1 hypothetical protein [Leuconostoc pseudomesenteroides]